MPVGLAFEWKILNQASLSTKLVDIKFYDNDITISWLVKRVLGLGIAKFGIKTHDPQRYKTDTNFTDLLYIRQLSVIIALY